MSTFYQLAVGNEEDAWHLEIGHEFSDGSPVDIWAYRGVRRLENPKPVPFRIQIDGRRVDHYDSASCATVVSRRLAEIWQSLADKDIQRIPATVHGDAGQWEVVNVISNVDCIDHRQSKITYFPPDDPERPSKPRGVLRLVLDPSRIGDHDIFHPKDWEVATIVSEAVKTAMEQEGITGVDYWPVTNVVTEWTGDWKSRVRGRVKEHGYGSLAELLARSPSETYDEIANRLGRPSGDGPFKDIGSQQVQLVQFEDASGDETALFKAARDALVRIIRKHLYHGWDRGRHREWIHSMARDEWANAVSSEGANAMMKHRAEAIWNNLVAQQPPPGWLPESPSDPFIDAAFSS